MRTVHLVESWALVNLEHAYHRAPYAAKVVAATSQGLLLRSRRYGRATDRLVREAIERESWSSAQWCRWEQAHLASVLAGARTHVPAYRGEVTSVEIGDSGLSRWPLLEKERLRADPRSFIRDDAPARLITEHTSGSTATPLSLFISKPDYRAWYALVEARWRQWYGVSRDDRWGIIGGQPVARPDAAAPPYWVWNASMLQLYLSSYHVAERTASDYVHAMDRHRITYLLGYPSSIHALAVACQQLGIAPEPLRVVITNAEPLLDYQRATIAEVFGCPVRETYGMAEYVAAASECEHGRLHLWPEVGLLEVVESGSGDPVPPGETGTFACTGLLNRSMPLIRYLVGDAGAIAATGETCPCRRTLPMLKGVDGRCDDLVRTLDGRLIGRLDPVFKGNLPIGGAQIVQESLDRFRVLVVPADGYGELAADEIRRRLRERVGEVRVDVEVIDRLPSGANGKFKAVISRVDPAG